MKRKKKAGIHHIRKREGFLKKHKQSIFEDTKVKKKKSPEQTALFSVRQGVYWVGK